MKRFFTWLRLIHFPGPFGGYFTTGGTEMNTYIKIVGIIAAAVWIIAIVLYL